MEITNRCNHACIFCPHHKMHFQQGEIDVALLKRILGEAYEMGLRRVGLYTTGEMFMCKNVTTHVRNAKEIGFKYIYADTNGALADEKKLAEVIEAGLDSIKFSINAGSKKTYELIHGHDDFDQVIKNLKTCYELKKKINPKLKMMISFVITKETEQEADRLKEMTSPYVDVFHSYPLRVFSPQIDEKLNHLQPETYREKPQVKERCTMVFNRIHVTYDGFLTACCIDFGHELLLADLKVMPLQQAWEGENAVSFRKRHMQNQLEGTMCGSCLEQKYMPYAPLQIDVS